MKKFDTPPTRIVVHCTATLAKRDFTVDDIRAMHKRRGFDDIGYHYLVTRDGFTHVGRDIKYIGAGAIGFNSTSIHVCYVGGLSDVTGSPADTRTEAQKQGLTDIISYLVEHYPINSIVGHRDLPAVKKACPCFNAKREYAYMLKRAMR